MMKDIKNTVPLVFIFISILLSCDGLSENDFSLKPEEYQEIGFPDHSDTWNYMDYQKACDVLSNIKTVKPHALPRKDSKRSGKIFNRIINDENLSFLIADTMTLNEKAFRIQKYIDIQGCLITAYTDLDAEKQYYNRELIDLYIFGLTIAQDMLDLGHLINQSVEEKNIEMQYAYPSIQRMYITMVLFVLGNQKKSQFFEEKDLERLSGFIYDSITINREWMDEASTGGIIQMLQKIADNTGSKEIRQKYTELAKILNPKNS